LKLSERNERARERVVRWPVRSERSSRNHTDDERVV